MKLAFWKKDKDDFDKMDDMGKDPFGEQLPSDPFSKGYPNQYGQDLDHEDRFDVNRPFEVKQVASPIQQSQAQSINFELLNKNIELVSAKLDSLKTEIESMNHRLMTIEAIARKEQIQGQNSKRYW